MRWVFALLLVGNGIYFYFQQFMVQPTERRAVVNAAQVNLGAAVVLLSELPAEDVAGVVSLGVEEQKPVDETPVCWMLGPFKEKISAKQVRGRLSALEIKFSVKEIQVPGKPDYWVHIKPQPSRKLAIRVLRDLQLKKVDSFLITEGELANGISLGLFSERLGADRLFLERKDQGLDVDLKEVSRVYTEVWLLSDQGEYGKFSDALWEKIKQGHGGIERRKNYCNAIASSDKLH
jgi:hypothetical protein